MSRKITYIKGQDSIYERLYQGLVNGTFRGICGKATKWLKDKKLDAKNVQAGYNSHQFHLRNPELIDELLQIGFLIKVGRSKYDTPGFTSFGTRQIIFPLRDETGNVINFCCISMKRDRCEFLNENGIYPRYPAASTTHLYITQSILDAATIMESGLIRKLDAVICVPDGTIKTQHENAISGLKQLQSIVWIEGRKQK
jgi:DNA primase